MIACWIAKHCELAAWKQCQSQTRRIASTSRNSQARKGSMSEGPATPGSWEVWGPKESAFLTAHMQWGDPPQAGMSGSGRRGKYIHASSWKRGLCFFPVVNPGCGTCFSPIHSDLAEGWEPPPITESKGKWRGKAEAFGDNYHVHPGACDVPSCSFRVRWEWGSNADFGALWWSLGTQLLLGHAGCKHPVEWAGSGASLECQVKDSGRCKDTRPYGDLWEAEWEIVP